MRCVDVEVVGGAALRYICCQVGGLSWEVSKLVFLE